MVRSVPRSRYLVLPGLNLSNEKNHHPRHHSVSSGELCPHFFPAASRPRVPRAYHFSDQDIPRMTTGVYSTNHDINCVEDELTHRTCIANRQTPLGFYWLFYTRSYSRYRTGSRMQCWGWLDRRRCSPESQASFFARRLRRVDGYPPPFTNHPVTHPISLTVLNALELKNCNGSLSYTYIALKSMYRRLHRCLLRSFSTVKTRS